ncbi:DUF3054 domain-containing protein [Nocardiopsis akebiae]|uniref:DUF3054 domain-containing protein n=1 Tax=Nocardiopsis akebiae TaxID=2831968 RepID=A0ABX8C6I6_9ACTN|nr:DUF3054 domain-containing protein [Nocardiopsis akebiae]QUX30039.1 DUF3054 domain-containing protein [Nocardiopsis akebiae]
MRSSTAPRALAALLADLVCVLAFVVIGRTDHGTGTALAEIAWTAWPFAAATVLGWAVTRAWTAPVRIWPTGLFVWAVTVVGGMAVRVFLGEGAPTSFVIVTSLFLAATMLGWRWVALVVAKRRQRRA